MQLSPVIALIAATAVANALECTSANAKILPDSVKKDLQNIGVTLNDIMVDAGEELRKDDTLAKRQPQMIICKNSEICGLIEGILLCYDEKTTAMTAGEGTATYVLKSGDVVLPDQTKGNVYNDIEPIKEAFIRQIKKIYSGMTDETEESGAPVDPSPSAASSVASPTVSSTSSTAVSASVSASASSAAKQSAGDDNEDSAAGMLIGGGWLAAAAALAAVIIV